MHKILIGGQALVTLGSTRSTNDVDYLVNDTSTKDMFIHHKIDEDWINANGHAFFKEIWDLEKDKVVASPQSLLELKAFSLVQHCINRKFQKADEAEFDMKFLCRTFKLTQVTLVQKYITKGQFHEVFKVIHKVKNENNV